MKLDQMNILVGPNNCGKSTVLAAFRALDAAFKKARSKSAELIRLPTGTLEYGHMLSADQLPISVENVLLIVLT
jgi:predicted ATP-dependent endonuclease of OLD family